MKRSLPRLVIGASNHVETVHEPVLAVRFEEGQVVPSKDQYSQNHRAKLSIHFQVTHDLCMFISVE